MSSDLEEDQAQEVLSRGGEMCRLPSWADMIKWKVGVEWLDAMEVLK